MAISKSLIILFVISSIFFYLVTEDLYRVLAILYGLIIAVVINVQSHRTVKRSISKVYQQTNNALTSLFVGELVKIIFLWAMLIIGYKGLGFAVKEMVFSFILFYLFFIIWNSFPKRP